jgi:hypothetical protein
LEGVTEFSGSGRELFGAPSAKETNDAKEQRAPRKPSIVALLCVLCSFAFLGALLECVEFIIGTVSARSMATKGTKIERLSW